MIEAANWATVNPRASLPIEQVEKARKTKQSIPEQQTADVNANSVQPEELLDQIKSLTEDGLFSVRFENDSNQNGLIVKIVDQQSGEVVREIPPEDLRELSLHLKELRGNMVDTVG